LSSKYLKLQSLNGVSVSTPERFIDGIGNLAVQGAVARIELTVIEKLPLQDETPQLAVAERLVMSVDTMLRLYQGLGEVVGQMEGKGLIKKREDAVAKKK
jgi:hypothetical protein